MVGDETGRRALHEERAMTLEELVALQLRYHEVLGDTLAG